MNLLLDTNALLWWLSDSSQIGARARAIIADARNTAYVSAASGWEIAIKMGLGRLQAPPDPATWLPEALAANRFRELPIELRHALAVERLPRHHADPFDRILVAQAAAEAVTIVSGDPQLELYDVPVIRC